MGKRALTRLLWLAGLKRPPEPSGTASTKAPWRPFTVPNGVSALRLLSLPAVGVVSFREDPASHLLPVLLFAALALSDLADGALARLTGQYSRLGALLDPLSDRLVVVLAVSVDWYWSLLPPLALGLMAGREVVILLLGRLALKKGVEIPISRLGRVALTVAGAGLLLGLLGLRLAGTVVLGLGLLLSYAAAANYLGQGLAASRRP